MLQPLRSPRPECLAPNLENILTCFLKQLGSRREMISEKASDLIDLARETLGVDLLLPQFVNILNKLHHDVS